MSLFLGWGPARGLYRTRPTPPQTKAHPPQCIALPLAPLDFGPPVLEGRCQGGSASASRRMLPPSVDSRSAVTRSSSGHEQSNHPRSPIEGVRNAVCARCMSLGDFVDLPPHSTVKCMCFQAAEGITTVHTSLCPLTVSPVSLSRLPAGITFLRGGTVTWPKKHRKYSAPKKFLQGAEADSHCDAMVQFCGAIPPPPVGGNRHDIGGGITRGCKVVCSHARCR